MRVGITVDHGMAPEGGGCLQYLVNLVPRLAEEAPADEFVLVHARGAGRRFAVPDQNVRWVEVPLPRLVLHRLAWPVLGHPAVERFTGPLDVFHNTMTTTAVPARAPTVVTIHDLFPELYPAHAKPTGRLFRKSLVGQARRRADAVIADSEATKRDVVEHLGVPARRVHTVHLALPRRPEAGAAATASVLADYGLTGPYLLFLGRIDPRKNVRGLLDGFAAFRRQDEDGPVLVLAGAEGWRAEEVRRRAGEADLAGNVRFLGHVPDDHVPGLMAGATAFVYPSLYEGFGFPLLEAAHCGTPVAASGTSSIPELMGDAAVYFDPRRPEQMAAAMRSLVDDGALRDRLVAEGRRRLARFSWERTARETLAVYRAVAAGSG